jgi:hypothetical protein
MRRPQATGRDLRNITDGGASWLLIQPTSNGSCEPVLRVMEVSYVRLGVMLVVADHDHFVEVYLTPLARQELSTSHPRRVQVDHFVRLVAWETTVRQRDRQPIVSISRLVIYPLANDPEG